MHVHYSFRFGEESLQSCEVMLHDIEESKRTNNLISSACTAQIHTQQQLMTVDSSPTTTITTSTTTSTSTAGSDTSATTIKLTDQKKFLI